MKNSIAFIFFLMALMTACQSPEQRAKDNTKVNEMTKKKPTPKNQESSNDQQKSFLNQAAANILFELELATQMIKTTENPDVQNLATIVLKTHLQAKQELQNLATRVGFNWPKKLNTAQQKVLAKIKAMEEYQKNLFYTQLTIKNHQSTINIFTKGTKLSDTAIANFAKKQLQLFKQNLREAQKVRKIMLKIKTDKGDLPLKRSNDNDKNYQQQH